MGTFRVMLAVSLLFLSLVGCSTVGPQARLATYFGANSTGTSTEKKTWAKGPTGLVVINDTSFGNSAPQLSEESLHAIKQHVEARLTKEVSMALEPLEFPHQSALPVDPALLLQQAKDHQMDYLVLAVVSSTEIEAPDRLPLQGRFNGGGGRGLLNGYRAENFALAELALLDVKTGQVLLQSDGQAWASLERLDVPLESNVYPVVRRDVEMPPIYPTSEGQAHDVLRAVASSEAINQAVMHFSESWKNVRG